MIWCTSHSGLQNKERAECFAHFLSATQLKCGRDRPESALMSEQWKHQIRPSKQPSASPPSPSLSPPWNRMALCVLNLEKQNMALLDTHMHTYTLPRLSPAPLSKHLWCGARSPVAHPPLSFPLPHSPSPFSWKQLSQNVERLRDWIMDAVLSNAFLSN